MIKEKSKAFTLAEVLVTLVIIGVISALTIPTLKEASDRSANIAALKKAYSTLSNAFAELQAEHGSPIYWQVPADAANAPEDIKGRRVFGADAKAFAWMLKQKISVGQAGGVPPAGYEIKNLSGSSFGTTEGKIDEASVSLDDDSGELSFQSADNMFWFPSATYQGCRYEKEIADTQSESVNLCGYVVVDTNGAKGPNRMGFDVFVFDISTNGVIPHAGDDDCSDMSGNGLTCSAKLIKGDEHALDFVYE